MSESRNKSTDKVQNTMLHQKLSFAATEAYKLLRTNVLFALPSDKKCRIVGVTSSLRGDGKSTTAVNLAYTLAETGQKVLLIDADMRLPSIPKKLGIVPSPGLSNILVGMADARSTVQATGILDSWYVLAAGDIPPNPSELLGSKQMEALLALLANDYDFIVVDLPPVNIVTDALVISHFLDGLILVIRENYTERSAVNNCYRQLKQADIKILGVVLNASKEAYGGYKRYKRYKYYNKYGKYGKYSKYGKYQGDGYAKYQEGYGEIED